MRQDIMQGASFHRDSYANLMELHEQFQPLSSGLEQLFYTEKVEIEKLSGATILPSWWNLYTLSLELSDFGHAGGSPADGTILTINYKEDRI